MSIDLIKERLRGYQVLSKQEEINALKEIYQEIALAALARSNFFKIAAFQGGTCLRIVHHLKRFSEDLDFVLLSRDHNFRWNQFLEAIKLEFASFGLEITVRDKSLFDNNVKKAFLKQDSFGQFLELRNPVSKSDKQSIIIKLEIDINPPDGSSFELYYLEYPFPFGLVVQDLPSLFAGKCHALLRREYVKGRDWFDFLWYISKKTPVNYRLLAAALRQTGPELSDATSVDRAWLIHSLALKIREIDWEIARRDVENFLSMNDRKMLEAWSRELFLAQLNKL